jgi:hypothetical protein
VSEYKLHPKFGVIRLSDGAHITPDPANRDYAQYLAWAAIPGNVTEPADMPSLADVKAQLKAQVDVAAEGERMHYLTPGSGQAQTYELKRTEVARWRNAGLPAEPDAGLYPWAADRADSFGMSVHEVLTEWAARADAWVAVGIAIERVREAAKAAIDEAGNEAAARAIFDAVAWPSPG